MPELEILEKFLKNHEITREDEIFQDFEGYIKDEFFTLLDSIPLSDKNIAYEKIVKKITKLFLMIKFPEVTKKHVIAILNKDIGEKIKLYSDVFSVKLPRSLFNNSQGNYFLEKNDLEKTVLINELGQLFTEDIKNIEKYFNLQKIENINLSSFIRYIYIVTKKFPFRHLILHDTNFHSFVENIDVYETLIINFKDVMEIKKTLSQLEKKCFQGDIIIYGEKFNENLFNDFIKNKKIRLKFENSTKNLSAKLNRLDNQKELINPLDEFNEIFDILLEELNSKRDIANMNLKSLENLKFFIEDNLEKNTSFLQENTRILDKIEGKIIFLKSSLNKKLKPIIEIIENKIGEKFPEEINSKKTLNKKTKEKIDSLSKFIQYNISQISYQKINKYIDEADYKNAIYYLKQYYLLTKDITALNKLGDIYYNEKKFDAAISYFQEFSNKGGKLTLEKVELLAEECYRKRNYDFILSLIKKYQTPHLCFFAGLIFEKGLGFQMINLEKALKYYEKASSIEKGEKNYRRLYNFLNQTKNSRYINTDKVVKKGCFITSAVFKSLNKPNDCFELNSFRKFRDSWLKYQDNGKQDIEEYYKKAPLIVKNIELKNEKDLIYIEIWEIYLKKCLELITVGKYEEVRKTYSQMFLELKKKYL